MNQSLKVLLATAGGWHLPNTAKAFEVRGAFSCWSEHKNEEWWAVWF